MSYKKRGKGTSGCVSLKDIAQACGLSVMTVSRALRDTNVVSPQTRERVLLAARQMGYVPNRLASSFGRQKTMTVGVVIPDIEHSIFPGLIKGVESTLSEEGYNLSLCCSYDRPGKEYREIQALLERRVDGIILAPASTVDSKEAVSRIQAMGCPFVFVDRIIPGLDTDTVTVDDYEGAFQAVTHLIEQGYRSIAHITGPEGVWTAEERERGFKEAMSRAGLPIRSDAIVRGGFTVDEGEAAMERILGRTVLPDAVFCVNDPIALGVFKALRRRGLRVPEAIGLAGFSDILESEIMEVPLTTVSQDAGMLGQQAARLLLARMTGSGGSQGSVHQVIKSRLVVRRSTLRMG